MESLLLETMYELPSRSDVLEVVVTAETVERNEPPLMVTKGSEDAEAS
jgi:ATP-dependent Clp protease ATP-binding subunit ClpX